MKRVRVEQAVTLIELVLVVAISAVVILFLWSGVRYLQQTLSQQMRLERVSQTLILTQEIARSIREARRIISVGPDHLDLEVYNHAAYGLLDPQLYEKTKRVSYRFKSEGEATSMARDVYASTDAVNPETSKIFLKDVHLLTPTATEPFFFASYLVGPSTVGVRVELALQPPYSTDRWVPIKDEVYVQTD